ncbi:MAG: response regulator [Candidatus Paceibacterota bacterium]|jgi:CheY-like chemotaxis protein
MSKIFIIDDDVFITRMYERIFRLENHEVLVAHDGEEAIKLLEVMNPPPDLIALDIMMPKMNGLDLLRKIRTYKELKEVPVVVLTNSFEKEHEKEFSELGVSLYLVKMENTPKEIVQKLEEVIKIKK